VIPACGCAERVLDDRGERVKNSLKNVSSSG